MRAPRTRSTWNVVYTEIIELPRPMAQALQILRSGQALASLGPAVHVFARLEERADVPRTLTEMLGAEPVAQLRVHPLLFSHKGLAGMVYRTRLAFHLQRPRDRSTVFYGRSRRHTLALLRARRRFRSRARVVYEFHNVESELAREEGDPERAERVFAEEREICAHADAVVAISAPLAEDVSRLFAPRRAPAVIPDGVDLEAFRGLGRAALTRPEVEIVYAGSLYAYKGVDELLAMLAFLPPRVRLTIVGGQAPSDLERLRRLASADARLAARVRFTGLVAPAEVRLHLEGADLVCVPAGKSLRSRRYTSPLKLFEAMASGIPIVAASTPALTSVLDDGKTAWIASGEDPRSLARGVERALEDRERSRAVGRAAAEAAQAYSWEARAQQILALVESLA